MKRKESFVEPGKIILIFFKNFRENQHEDVNYISPQAPLAQAILFHKVGEESVSFCNANNMVFWYNTPMYTKRIWYSANPELRSPDTIHQILMYGTLQEIKSLKNALGEKTVRELFLRYPKKVYTVPALNFIKNFVLDINTHIDDQKYLKTTPRYIG